MGKIKYLGEPYKEYVKAYKTQKTKVSVEGLTGIASLLEIEKISSPFMIGDLCLYDDGYKEIGFLPDNGHWMVWAIYDDKDNIIEWYFDITKENGVDKEGRAYCEDLYIDAVLRPDGQIIVLDEDELKEALDAKLISREDFDMAYSVLNNLIDGKIIDLAFMESFCGTIRETFGRERA